MSAQTIRIPLLRSFPRWLGPLETEGPPIPEEHLLDAQAAYQAWQNGERTAANEERILRDPELALRIANEPDIHNRLRIQNAALQKPLNALALRNRCPWADSIACAKAANNHAELAWEFQYHHPTPSVPIPTGILLQHPHYAWRATHELNLPAEQRRLLTDQLDQHPLYGTNKKHLPPGTRQLLALLQSAQPTTPQQLEAILATHPDPLNAAERDILIVLLTSPPNRANLALHKHPATDKILQNEPTRRYHLARYTEGTIFNNHTEILLQTPGAAGWLLQLGYKNPQISAQALATDLVAKHQDQRSLLTIERWFTQTTHHRNTVP